MLRISRSKAENNFVVALTPYGQKVITAPLLWPIMPDKIALQASLQDDFIRHWSAISLQTF
jgi:hypothetical protein